GTVQHVPHAEGRAAHRAESVLETGAVPIAGARGVAGTRRLIGARGVGVVFLCRPAHSVCALAFVRVRARHACGIAGHVAAEAVDAEAAGARIGLRAARAITALRRARLGARVAICARRAVCVLAARSTLPHIAETARAVGPGVALLHVGAAGAGAGTAAIHVR